MRAGSANHNGCSPLQQGHRRSVSRSSTPATANGKVLAIPAAPADQIPSPCQDIVPSRDETEESLTGTSMITDPWLLVFLVFGFLAFLGTTSGLTNERLWVSEPLACAAFGVL